MIKIINDMINDFIRFLDENYGIEQVVYIHLVENCDYIETPNGETGIGLFDDETDNIYIACDWESMDNETILTTIAHEYKHFLQKYENDIYDEDEADKFANKVFEDYIKKEN